MAATGKTTPFSPVKLDPRSKRTLYQQLYDELRHAVLDRRLAPSSRLPSTRALASDLGIGRNTVAAAYDQLIAEGYLRGLSGSGTFVASALPDTPLLPPNSSPAPEAEMAVRKLSRRGQHLAANTLSNLDRPLSARPFRPGCPALDAFPHHLWARLLSRNRRTLPSALLGYGEPAGYVPLRKSIAAYVSAARGVRCTWEQVIVVAGAQQGLDLTARLMLDPGDAAWMEDPGYRGARGALQAAGARIVSVPIDDEGLQVAEGDRRAPDARLAYVSPSHQFPLGATMSLSRRLALLQWARRHGAWVMEDDYDSEYRYRGRPLAALQGLDATGCVIYLGTFSKVLYPALRLGYLVVPAGIVDAFIQARAISDRQSPLIEQIALAEFMEEGHFGRHLRRMRALYAERQELLLAAASKQLGGLLQLTPDEAGLHLTGWLPRGISDRAAAARLAAAGIEAQPLSEFCEETKLPPGLLIGYAAFNKTEIDRGIKKMKTVLEALTR